MNKLLRHTVIPLWLVLTAACGETLVHAPHARVGTPQIEIDGGDGKFALTETASQTPFGSEACTGNDASPEAWQSANSTGGQAVTLKHPQVSPLYGVLKLCALNPAASGPWQSEYLIEVPQSYVDATADGKTSVVRESVGGNYSWVLWLSRTPLQPMGSPPDFAAERHAAKVKKTIGKGLVFAGVPVLFGLGLLVGVATIPNPDGGLLPAVPGVGLAVASGVIGAILWAKGSHPPQSFGVGQPPPN